VTVDRRAELLQTSYKEVLDATKHQDEKIGYMLTAISFLTAAALALADFLAGRALSRTFVLGKYDLHDLALLALLAFLVTVVFGVALLVLALATPLRDPGLPRPDDRVPRPDDTRVSQIYFYSIARTTEQEWRDKWQSQDNTLEGELIDMYVNETHNLAVRTDFKYNRTTEAVATFTVGVLALGVAIILAVAASGYPCTSTSSGGSCTNPVQLSGTVLGTLGAVVAAYTALYLLVQLRYSWRSLEDIEPIWCARARRKTQRWRNITAYRVSAPLIGGTAGFVLACPFTKNDWVAPGVGCALVVAVLYIELMYKLRASERPTWERYIPSVVCVSSELSALVLVVIAALRGSFGAQLLAGFSLVLGPAVAAGLGPSCRSADDAAKARR
jgi:hypothetical protein